MSQVNAILDATRSAIDELAKAGEGSAAHWTTPRAPGKWSPAQVVEHVALALEESANVVSGAPTKFPTFPALLRPIVRGVFFNRVLKKSAFPKAKTTKAFNPPSGPATPQAGRQRLESAFAAFDAACRTRSQSGGQVESGIFGTVSVADYARFQELHVRHHRKQL
jgi:hypothetical protein